MTTKGQTYDGKVCAAAAAAEAPATTRNFSKVSMKFPWRASMLSTLDIYGF